MVENVCRLDAEKWNFLVRGVWAFVILMQIAKLPFAEVPVDPFAHSGSSLLTPASPTVLAISEVKNDLTVILILSETGHMNIYLRTIFFLYCELMV